MTRGVVFLMEDFIPEWIEWAKEGEINSIGLHKMGGSTLDEHFFERIHKDFSERIELCEQNGITVEYELHALSWLLPRRLFEDNPCLFRVKNGVRTPDVNCCASSVSAMNILSENAYETAKRLKQSSHNYYFWTDDAYDGLCECDLCKGMNGADQNMRLVNAMLRGVKAYDSKAKMAFLAYQSTMELPTDTPGKDIFLEFAPIERDLSKAMTDIKNAPSAGILKRLLEVFAPSETHALEYWLDSSLFSKHKYPPVQVPFNPEVIAGDIRFYRELGVETIKTFSAFMGKQYLELYGKPPLKEFGGLF